ncbi:MAG: WD40 repeat domain-containing protein [Leptolyngbya sp. SIO1D8]|nr:WD40 repeat domain-containing protein [Leptolyngbya sp. SIO1D8]
MPIQNFSPLQRLSLYVGSSLVVVWAIAHVTSPQPGQSTPLALCPPSTNAAVTNGLRAEGVKRPAAIAEFIGNFYTMTPDGQHLFTYSEAENLTRLYAWDGNEKAQFQGFFHSHYSPDGQMIITSSPHDSTDYLYTLDGVEKARLVGFRAFTPDGQGLVTVAENEEMTRLLDLNGEEIAVLEGGFDPLMPYRSTFSPDGQGIITFSPSNQQYRVFDLDGTERFRFQGAFSFTHEGQDLIISTEDFGVQVLSLDGKVKITFPGEVFKGFSPIEQTILLFSKTENLTRLATLEGSELATFEGEFKQYTPDQQGLLTYASNPEIYRLYTLEGEEKLSFSEEFRRFTPDGEWLITVSFGEITPTSHLVRLDGTDEILLEGVFYTFLPDDQNLMTETDTGTYSLYTLTGELQSTFDAYPIGYPPNGIGVVVYSPIEQVAQWLDFDGTVKAIFSGEFLGFTPDEQSVMTYLSATATYHLYTSDGDLITFFSNHSFVDWPRNGPGLFFYQYDTQETYLVDSQGREQVVFDGYFRELLAEEKALIAYRDRDKRSFLFCF